MTMTLMIKTAGMSLIGILLGIAVGAIILGAVSLFVGRGVDISREQTEQVRITEDARIQLDRMSDTIRNAKSFDSNNDGLATLPTEIWLQHGDDLEIDFYTNVDSDSDIERVRYFVVDGELRRGVRDPYSVPATAESVTVLSRSIRNTGATPIFRYYGGTEVETPVVAPGTIERVGISLLVDYDPNQDPAPATVGTTVAPRVSKIFPIAATPTPSVSPSPSP